MMKCDVRRLWPGVLVFALITNVRASAEETPAKNGQAKVWTPEFMLQVPRVGSVQPSPDGKSVVYTLRRAVLDGDKSEYRTHLFRCDSQGEGTRQLTQGDHSCDDPQWSPDGRWIAFLSSRGGKRAIWLIAPDAGEAMPWVEMPSDITGFKWAPDAKSVAFTATDPPTKEEEARKRQKDDAQILDRDIKLSRLYLAPFSEKLQLAREPRLLTPGILSVLVESGRSSRFAFDWSPDHASIVFAHSRSPNPDDWGTADLSIVRLSDGQIQQLAATSAAESMPLYSPDGKSIVYAVSDIPASWAGARRLAVIAATGGEPRLLPPTKDEFGRYSEIVGWSASGKHIYYSEIDGTVFRLMAMPLLGDPIALSHDQGMSLTGVSLNATRTHFGYAWEQLNHPSEARISPVASFSPVTVSHVERDLDPPLTGKTDVIRWKSSDGLEIEGLLTHPLDFEQGKRYPLLVVIHGGPMGAFTQTYNGTASTYPIATFASQGYLILRANVRGSSGYGRKFRYANYGDWGGGDFQDLMSGVDHVIGLGIVDSERMGVMGWSYGGFMTAWTITQTDRFRAASVGAGVTNLVSFTGTADIPGFLPDYFGGEFWGHLETYVHHSPIAHVAGVKTPTLIQHGERDERVPLSQGLELYNALKRQKCSTQMVIYPRMPHSIDEPRLLLDCMRGNVEWFEKHVRRN